MNDNFYKQLIEKSPTGYAYHKIIYDDRGAPSDCEFIEVNEAFELFTGSKRSKVIGKRLTEIFQYENKSELNLINSCINNAMAKGKKEFEYFSKILNKWYRIYVFSPKQGYLVTYLNNISKEKNQFLELEKSLKRMENFVEGTNVGTWELNLQTGDVIHNERWAEIFGYTLKELSPIDKDTWRKFVHPDDLLQEFVRDEQLYNREIEYYDDEYRMKHKNGNWVWIHDQGKVISWSNDGKPLLISGTHTDITERKRAEEALKDSEQKYRLIFEHNPFGIIHFDKMGIIIKCNEEFSKIVGIPHEILVGFDLMKLYDLEFMGVLINSLDGGDDVIARLGGDEFVVILTKTDYHQAEQIIKRINDFVLKEKVGSIDISISFGYETKYNEKEDIGEIFKNAEDNMYRHKLYESSSIRNKTIDLIMNTLYEKSNREMLHSKRVSKICEKIAINMNFDKDNINQIRIAGLMHDIGKMGIDQNILNKPEALSDDEWKEMRRHPEIGYRILSSSNEFSEISEYVLKHHERWDGKGYPGGFKGEEISLQSRIIAVADSYDAMTSDRSYRKGLSVEDAIIEINRCSGTQFDPYVVKVFIEKTLKNIIK